MSEELTTLLRQPFAGAINDTNERPVPFDSGCAFISIIGHSREGSLEDAKFSVNYWVTFGT